MAPTLPPLRHYEGKEATTSRPPPDCLATCATASSCRGSRLGLARDCLRARRSEWENRVGPHANGARRGATERRVHVMLLRHTRRLRQIGEREMAERRRKRPMTAQDQTSESNAGLLRELVAHLRHNRTQLREEWARRITDAQLLTAMTAEEIFAEATSVYDNY